VPPLRPAWPGRCAAQQSGGPGTLSQLRLQPLPPLMQQTPQPPPAGRQRLPGRVQRQATERLQTAGPLLQQWLAWPRLLASGGTCCVWRCAPCCCCPAARSRGAAGRRSPGLCLPRPASAQQCARHAPPGAGAAQPRTCRRNTAQSAVADHRAEQTALLVRRAWHAPLCHTQLARHISCRHVGFDQLTRQPSGRRASTARL
jgi:hypothetical protein